MLVSELLAPDVPGHIRDRGREYFLQGRVALAPSTAHGLTAMVRGKREYEVEIQTDPFSDFFCDCPYAEENFEICKHIWATILAAEAAGRLKIDDRNDVREEKQAPARSRWENQLEQVTVRARTANLGEQPWPERRQILYAIDGRASVASNSLVLYMTTRERKATGTGWNTSRELKINRDAIALLPDPMDREIFGYIGGAANYSWGWSDAASVGARQQIRWPLSAKLMPLLCRTGRCYADLERTRGPLVWEDEPWKFALRLDQHRQQTNLGGVFVRGESEIDVQDPALVMRGFLITGTTAAPLDENAPLEWIAHLRISGAIVAPFEDAPLLLGKLLEHPEPPPILVPESLQYQVVSPEPKKILHVARARGMSGKAAPRLDASIFFDYAGTRIPSVDSRQASFNPAERVLFRRNTDAEKQAKNEVLGAGVRELTTNTGTLRIGPRELPAVVRTLIPQGWHVEAEGRVFRSAGASTLSVTSGVDWFELRGDVDYGGERVTLPQILQAVRSGESVVQLGDGSWGLLPEEWLRRLGAMTEFASIQDDHLRFRQTQAALLDALLAAQPEVHVDEVFARAREQLRSFEGIRPAGQPEGFRGTLRHYQLDGLGWMEFLRQFGFGGCLADDMGVGKTPQVLAVLESRRAERAGPSLIVVPRSLIFNWVQEAARFTPALRILDHTGMDRTVENVASHHVVLTTYGTMRRDIEELRQIDFDYIILDEAQSIRNPDTDSAKAARLLKGHHKLALTGTPVENRLTDLWSIFEFLNPGMLGSSRAFEAFSTASREGGSEDRKTLARALRPLILRRTKEQVAQELPEKTEQTLFCELEPAQRKLYDELRDYYRVRLLDQIGSKGLAKSKMQVLEALLRLRQAACHPALIDPAKKNQPGAKVELLLERLSEVAAEGHKALVFSQFTSLLAIVRRRLDEDSVTYEYLDGRTRDRQTPVQRFQEDPNCRLFLISLKAGGLGLNLTAADYVFLLDPWWNPAVEAQAIDRAHRIGQVQHVFAYRIIAKDTVEEKVLELQKSKRDLAAAIIGEENRILTDLKTEDLELLLS